MLNRLNHINKYNKEIRNNNKNSENNIKNRVNNNKNENSHMTMMLCQSNSNQKYPMWTHSSHRATWPIVMPRIILEFKSKKCWDYVDPENGPVNEVNADNAEVLENTFEEEAINVALRVAQEEQALTLLYEEQFQSTEQFLLDSNLPPAQLRSEQVKNFANRTNQMTTMVSNRLIREKTFRDLENDRKVRKKEHDDKIASCITVFNSVFNSHYLRDYTQDIQNHRFRNVWMRICVSNSVTNVGYNFTAGTFKRLNSWVYDINFTMQENINYYEGMILSLGTHVYPEDLKLANFLNGIEESPQCSTILKQYVHSLHNRDNLTYEYAREGLLNKFQDIQARSLFKERKNPRDSANLVRQAKRGRTANDGVSGQDGKGSNNAKHQDPQVPSSPQFPDSLPKKCSFCNAIGHTERYCFKKWPCKVCGQEHNQLKHHGTTNSAADDTTLGGMFQRNLNQSTKYYSSSSLNVEKIQGTGHPEGISTFEFDSDVTVTTPVHSLDTSDRRNDSAVTDTSASFNAAVTDSDSTQNLLIVRADVPTTNDIAINNCENSHLTDHQGESDYLSCHFICDALFNAIHDQSKENQDIRVIIDSGATSHMLPSKEYFTTYNEYNGEVALGDNSLKLPIIGIGNTSILNDVLHVPDLSMGLISISQLDTTGHVTLFKHSKVYIFNRNGRILFTGTKYSSLYYLDSRYILRLQNHIANVVTRSGVNAEPKRNGTAPKRLVQTTFRSTPQDLLHRRWGHASEESIKRALRLDAVIGANMKYDEIKDTHLSNCFDCRKGRMRRFVHNPITTRIYKVLEKINIDFKGPFRTKTIHGETGFFLFVDQLSGYLRPYLIRQNNSATLLACLIDFLQTVVRPAEAEWKILQGDFHSVLISETIGQWLKQQQIKLQLSAPYDHAQNGCVEVNIGIVMDRCRTVMNEYEAPRNLWGYAVEYICHTINCTRVLARNDKTAHELIHGQKPDVSKFVPFYVPGIAYVSADERRDKHWANKGEPIRFLGYSEHCKDSYIILYVKTRAILVRNNCLFDENLYHNMRDFAIGDPNSGGIEGNLESLLNSNLRTERKRNHVKDYSDKFAYNSSDDNDMSHIDYHRVNLGVDYTDEIIDYDEEVVFENDCPYNVDSNEEMVSEEVVNVTEWFNETIQRTFNSIKLPKPPSSPEEAMNGPDKDKWIPVIMKEFKQMDDKGVMEIAKDQSGHGMKTKVVLTITYDNEMNLKYKARLVGCGYSQIKFRDYDETYAPTIATMIILLVMHLASSQKMHMGTFDVSGAFLEANNDYTNYAWLPAVFFGKRIRVVLKKALYGEKQAGKLWNDLCNNILIDMGFERCGVAPCLYIYNTDGIVVYLCIHVDDGLLCTNNVKSFEEFKKIFTLKVDKITIVQPLIKYVGIQTKYDRINGYILCNQSAYITEHLPRQTQHERIPMSPSYNLRKCEPNSTNESLLPITGKLRYLADRTRWDICATVGEISTGGSENPSDEHVRTAQKTVNYLWSTVHLSLRLGGLGKLSLFCFSDASYITEGNSKSRLGGVFYMGLSSGAFYAFSKQAQLVALSSCHAELQALDEVIRITIHLITILRFMQVRVTEPVKIFIDNKSAIELCTMLKTTHKTSSINVRVNFIRECINKRVIELHFIQSNLNVADIMTKQLSVEAHERHTYRLLHGFDGRPIEDLIEQTHVVMNI